MDPDFEFLFIVTVLLTVGLLLRRIGQLEGGEAPPEESGDVPPAANAPRSGGAMDADTDTWALLVAPLVNAPDRG